MAAIWMSKSLMRLGHESCGETAVWVRKRIDEKLIDYEGGSKHS